MPVEQILFLLAVLAAFGCFGFTCYRVWQAFSLTQSGTTPRLDRISERIVLTLLVAFGQQKMFKRPVAGILHALVWWGFLVITIGTLEMLIDGLAGTERILGFMGGFYNFVIASGEVLAAIVILASVVFLIRRYFVKPRRFEGEEMKPSSRYDATFILIMILLLMVTLLGMNIGYVKLHTPLASGGAGWFPVSAWLLETPVATMLPENLHAFERTNWWAHILLVLLFLNILPYSKHFHVILAVPNVFLSRLQPKARLNTMDAIKKEIERMMNPEAGDQAAEGGDEDVPERFGVKDAEDASWKNLMDAYTCTECGRCTAVCPANLTGKKLSPRKLYVDLRKRMTEKTDGLLREGDKYDDGKSLVGDYITEEELWACTSCMACMEECPVNIDHVPFIMDMRRNLVMEETKTSPELNNMFSNIENNGAPWPYNQEDRLKWAEGIELKTMADMQSEGKEPEVLFWVGCAGCFDDRYQKVTRAFAAIMNEAGIEYAVLGKEESCTGDPAKRAGHEFIFQMQATQNIETLNNYNIKKIVTACPHCFNTLKNEYPDMGGHYEVVHHSVFLKQLIAEGRVKVKDENMFNDKSITYHDACYLGRGNDIFEAPREVIESLKTEIREMSSCKEKGLCCGAGGAQMFKEPEAGNKDVNIERSEQALETQADYIASACPFCMTMMTDGVKDKDKAQEVKVLDLAELVAKANGLDK